MGDSFAQRSGSGVVLPILLRTLLGGKWLCVVVKYSVVEPFVLTAYLTDKPKKGEVLWRKP